MSVNILVPSTPKRLQITETMICDFIIDPVLGVEVIFKEKLDAFQRARLKICWWTPRVMDSSGFSSTKTRGMWWVSTLRALLLPNHVCGVYYPNFESGKRIYWKYFREVALKSPLFQAQCGRDRVIGLDGKSEEMAKAMDRGPSCWVFQFKNESQIMMPAPNFLQGAKTQAGHRFNDLYIDEWTKVESVPGKGEGIDDQLVGRTTRDSYNKKHPIYCNHHLFLATAEDTLHPAYSRYKDYLKEMKSGNPDYYCFSFSFKDYSDLPFDSSSSFKDKFREDRAVKDIRRKGRAGYLQEALGFWSKNGKGWYTQDMINHCYAVGRSNGSDYYCSRNEDPLGFKAHYFLGVDPAKAEEKKSDDGALVVLRVVPLLDSLPNDTRAYALSYCYGYRVRKADVAQWSGLIHKKHQHFRFSGICMDPGGGGIWIQPELRKTEQKIGSVPMTVRPIGTLEDEENILVAADFVLSMFRPRDMRVKATWSNIDAMKWENLIEVAHEEFRDGLTQGIGFPPPFKQIPREKTQSWPQEKLSAINCISDPKTGVGAQLLRIFVVTTDGGIAQLSKATQARKFASRDRKDFAYAAMYAYVSFKMWLSNTSDEVESNPEDAAMCLGSELIAA